MNPIAYNDIKISNRNRILDALRRYGAADMARLSEITGLSKLTVGKIVGYWRDKGVVKAAGKGNSAGEAAGKKPTLFSIDPEYKLIFVARICETSLLSSVTDLSARVILSERADFGKNERLEVILRHMRDAYDRMSGALRVNDSKFAAVVLGANGVTDSEEGVILISPHFKSWGCHVPVLGMLRDIFPSGFTLHVDNWVRYLAYAELKIGAARQARRFLVIGTEPDGVNSGLVWDGELVSGKRGLAGEIGHMPVDIDSDVVCICGGKGCLEPAISLMRMQERARKTYGEWPDSILSRGNPEGIAYGDIFVAADRGDAFARHLLDASAKYFAAAVVHVMQVCDPELVIIQGEYANAGSYFLDRVKERAGRISLHGIDKNIRVQYSSLAGLGDGHRTN